MDKAFIYIALTNFISLSTFIYALQLIDMVTVSAISYLTPIVMSLLGVFILREKLSFNIVISLIISVLGTLLIIAPTLGNSAEVLGVISSLTSAIGWAIHDLLLKKQSKVYWAKQSFILLALCIPISLPFAIATWQPLSIMHIKFLLILGILYATNKMFLIKALEYTRLILLAPIIYTKLIFAAIFAYFLFGEVLQLNTILGSTLIVSATIIVMYQGKQYSTNT
jgi:drug/metabolite transporter (DMT)-like permease